MVQLLGKNLEIRNYELTCWMDENGLSDFNQLQTISIPKMIDLIAFCSKITKEEMIEAFNNDAAFAHEIANAIAKGYNPGDGKKPIRPLKKGR